MERPAVTGSRVVAPENDTWIGKTWLARRPRGRREVSYINSGNLFVERQVFEKLGGFDEALSSGEDHDFCIRARALRPIVSDDGILVIHHGNPKTVAGFIRREMWHGMGMLENGRAQVSWKPIAASVAFGASSCGVLIGGLGLALGGGWTVLVESLLSVAALLSVTVWFRTDREARGCFPLRLAALYAADYLGRFLSIVYRLLGVRSRSEGHRRTGTESAEQSRAASAPRGAAERSR